MTQERQKCYDNVGYEPFDDRPAEPLKVQKQLLSENTKDSIDTRAIDAYRQGVSIRSYRDKFIGNQPKLGSGHPCHFTDVQVYGQSRDYTHYTETSAYTDGPERFNPVEFIQQGEAYPLPIELSGGPKEREEASVEPLEIPFKKSSVVGPYIARQIHGNFETGNEDIEPGKGNDEISQLIAYDSAPISHFFLDEGTKYYGKSLTANLPESDGHMLYILSQDRFSVSGSFSFVEDINGNGSLMRVTSPIFRAGPYTDTINNTTAFTNATASDNKFLTSVSDRSGFVITGSLTFESVFYASSTASGTKYFIDFDYFLVAAQFTTQNIIVQHTGISSQQFPWTTEMNLDDWNYIAVVRSPNITPGQFDYEVFLNGTSLGTATGLAAPADTGAPSTAYIGTLNGSSLSEFQERLAYVKITKDVLTEAQLTVELNRRFNPIDDYSTAITTNNYVPKIDRTIIPFNDTKEEALVDQLNTSNTEFLRAVRALDFDLSEDLRRDFSHKSATAGTTVYGGNSAQYGTDSISFANLTKGSLADDDSPVDLVNWNTDIIFSRATEATYQDGESVLIYANNIPRIIEGPNNRYLYTEGTRANLCTDHDTVPVAGNATVTQDIGDTAPDGTSSADRRLATGPDGYGRSAAANVTSSLEYTLSVFVKYVSGDAENAVVAVGTGFGGAGSTSFTATNNWIRYEHNIAAASSTSTGTGRVQEQGVNDDSEVDIWGWQIEEGGFSTQVIRTIGVPLTRAADDAYIPSAIVPQQMKTGRWQVDIYPRRASTQTADESTETLFAFATGTDDRIYFDTTTNQIRVRQGAVTKVSSNVLTWSANQKLTLTFDAQAGSITVTGATTGNGTVIDQTWTMPSNDVQIGNINSLNRAFFGMIGTPRTA